MAVEAVELHVKEPYDERRGLAMNPRRSWASAQPFDVRATPHNGPEARRGTWAEAVRSYRARALALDAAAVALVAGLTMPHVYGVDLEALGLIAAVVAGFVALVAIFRGYDRRSLGNGSAEVRATGRALLAAVVLLVLISYVAKAEISRLMVLVALPLSALLALLLRTALRRGLWRARARGEAMVRAVVIGDELSVARLLSDLDRGPQRTFAVVGVCLPSVATEGALLGSPVLGGIADTPQVVADRAVDVVLVAGSFMSATGVRRLSWALDRAGAQLVVAPNLQDVTAPRIALRPAGAGMSLLEVETGAPRSRMVAKSLFDRVLGGFMLLAASPIIGAAAAAVAATSPGGAFFKQTRIGVDGREFTMWKLRTMYRDAERRRAELLASSDGDGVLFKMRDDPRVTRVGKVLRRYSIDELPQLWNVVTGDMSLVGPRPPLAEEVAAYDDQVHRRLRVRPGLTGLWQVSGRSDLSWDDAVRLDLSYVDNWSLSMDLSIIWKTARVVLGAHGAY